jgi:hypothetical protein
LPLTLLGIKQPRVDSPPAFVHDSASHATAYFYRLDLVIVFAAAAAAVTLVSLSFKSIL